MKLRLITVDVVFYTEFYHKVLNPLWKRDVGETFCREVLSQDVSSLGRFIRFRRWHELCVSRLVGTAINKGT